MAQPVTLDMSTAQPIKAVTLDMSTAQPIASAQAEPQPEPGYLDKEIPLTSYGAATEQGFQTVGRGVRDAVVGIGSMIAHPIDTVKSIGQIPAQAAQVPGAISDINKSADPAGTYAKVAQNTAGQGAGQALTALATTGIVKGAGAAVRALPSAARAGEALQEIKSVAGDVPINTAKVGDTALEIYNQSQRGANLPSTVGKLVRRLTAPDSPPMTYEEAKDFQSNVSNLSASDKMRLNPNMRRLVGQLNADMKASLQDAADTAGKGEQFQQSMKEYHNAMKIRGYSDTAIDLAWKSALGYLGARKVAQIFGFDH